jgi:hypothetical protein
MYQTISLSQSLNRQRNFRLASVSLSANFNTKAIRVSNYEYITVDNDEHWKYDVETGWGNEGEESIVIPNTNAVINPGAMVVVALNANIANGAVARARGPDNFTIRT